MKNIKDIKKLADDIKDHASSIETSLSELIYYVEKGIAFQKTINESLEKINGCIQDIHNS